MSFKEFIETWSGKYCEIAGSPGAEDQCVDLENAYLKDVLNHPIVEWTNAQDFPKKIGNQFEFIKNTPQGIPEEGDLIVWEYSNNIGHIAIFIKGDVNKFTSFDQNYPLDSDCHEQEHSYSNVVGWLKYKGGTMTLQGIDISAHQGEPDYDKLKDNTDFIIIKATEGVGFTDPQLARGREEARKAGIPLGYYHFARPDLDNTAEEEANFFLEIADPNSGEILFLDFEVNHHSIPEWCKKWLDCVSEELDGYKPLIYLNQAHLKLDWSKVIDADYGLWLAAYLDHTPETPWPTVAFQQTSSNGTIEGIEGHIDTNIFFGDKTAFDKYGIGSTGGEVDDENNEYNECAKCTYTAVDPEDNKLKEWTGSTFASEWRDEKAAKIVAEEELYMLKEEVKEMTNELAELEERLSESLSQEEYEEGVTRLQAKISMLTSDLGTCEKKLNTSEGGDGQVEYSVWKKLGWRFLRAGIASALAVASLQLYNGDVLDYVKIIGVAFITGIINAAGKYLRENKEYEARIHKLPL